MRDDTLRSGVPRPGAAPRTVCILVHDSVMLLNVAGPTDVFNTANQESRLRGGPTLYKVMLLSRDGGPVTTSSGIEIGTTSLPDPEQADFDTIAVAGGMGIQTLIRDATVIAWLVKAAEGATRIASFGGGAFVLARAGLLDTRRCVTHWRYGHSLQQSYPKIKVDSDSLFVADGKLYTAAGSMAGVDLALQMVEEDVGKHMAMDVARILLVARKRPGEQPQISAELKAQSATVPKIAAAAEWISAHIAEQLRVPDIAERFGMSERNFSRSFKRDLGVSPQQFIVTARIEAARRWLVETKDPIEKIARRSGFSGSEHLALAFRKANGGSPAEYRSKAAPRLTRSAVPAIVDQPQTRYR